jgi:hypothetical protein
MLLEQRRLQRPGLAYDDSVFRRYRTTEQAAVTIVLEMFSRQWVNLSSLQSFVILLRCPIRASEQYKFYGQEGSATFALHIDDGQRSLINIMYDELMVSLVHF